MGCGTWTDTSYKCYTKTRKLSTTASGAIDSSYTVSNLYKCHSLHESLNPYKVVRECVDNDEHPNTFPVILCCDLTGSMGDACAKTLATFNPIITESLKSVQDIEFMTIGIGDFYYDDAPLQVTQFESDIRILEQLELMYQEHGGGGNDSESYSAAWLFGSRFCKLDCWNKGKKGIIITVGDEPLNNELPAYKLNPILGTSYERDIDTEDLYEEASKKFDIYHIHIDHNDDSRWYRESPKTFEKVIGKENVFVTNVDKLQEVITNIITSRETSYTMPLMEEITW